MAKRFIETSIWTQNKWFRKLPPKFKLLWFYLLTFCDTVGVWEEDLELASFIIGAQFTEDELLKHFAGRIQQFNGKKWWIVDFCFFQYGELKEDQLTNKPHQSYIALLKKHGLWIDYIKSINRLKEKDTDKDKVKGKDESKDLNKEGIDFEIFWNAYDKKIDRPKCEKKWNRLKKDVQLEILKHIERYKISQPDKKYRKNPSTYLNNESWENEIIKDTEEQQTYKDFDE